MIANLVFVVIIGLVTVSLTVEESSASYMSPRQQWEKFADPDLLTCKEGLVLLQKNNGYPACVTPSTYVKLIDREFIVLDFGLISSRPNMMSYLVQDMASNMSIMDHWHEMMLKNPKVINNTMSGWILKIKDDPVLLSNVIGPMASEPQLREKMISIMRQHPQMENYLKNHHAWMESVHKPMSPRMEQGMSHENCNWCPSYSHHQSMNHSNPHSDKMMDLIHHLWINDEVSRDMHELMLEDPNHMAMMSKKMMNQILNPMMNDPELREKITELLLEHPEFMDSVRHN